MKAEENGEHPIVAERPRGFNGIPESGELREPDVSGAASHNDSRFGRATRHENSTTESGVGYAPWIAAIAVLGGAITAIVGSSRELAGRSRRRACAWDSRVQETKPHGDKLLPHGQHHW